MLSPNGKWVAYASNESGRAEIYVETYPNLTEKIAISTDGGTCPVWSHDGRELFYRQGDAVMVVSVDTGAGLRPGKPRRLFAGPYRGESQEPAFDVSPDGRRFLMIKSDDAATLRQINVVQNWVEELKQRVSPNQN